MIAQLSCCFLQKLSKYNRNKLRCTDSWGINQSINIEPLTVNPPPFTEISIFKLSMVHTGCSSRGNGEGLNVK